MGDGRAKGSSAIGEGGQAAISLMADTDGTGSGATVCLKARNLPGRIPLPWSHI